jgi:hypothetical protein
MVTTWSSVIPNNTYADILDKAYKRYEIEYDYHMTFTVQDPVNIYKRKSIYSSNFNIFHHNEIKFTVPKNLINEFKIYLSNKLTNFKKVFYVKTHQPLIEHELDYDDAVNIALLSKNGLYTDTIFLIYQYLKPASRTSISKFINKLEITENQVTYNDFVQPLMPMVTGITQIRKQIIDEDQYLDCNVSKPKLNEKTAKFVDYDHMYRKARNRKKDKRQHVKDRMNKREMLYPHEDDRSTVEYYEKNRYKDKYGYGWSRYYYGYSDGCCCCCY